MNEMPSTDDGDDAPPPTADDDSQFHVLVKWRAGEEAIDKTSFDLNEERHRGRDAATLSWMTQSLSALSLPAQTCIP